VTAVSATSASSSSVTAGAEKKSFSQQSKLFNFNKNFLSLAVVASQVESEKEQEENARTVYADAKNKKQRRVLKKKRAKKGRLVNMRRS
jgi:hypothetical protein